MKKVNLTLDKLIGEMKNIIHNNDRYCFSDSLIDIQKIVKESTLGSFYIYWGVRRNGTEISELLSSILEWTKKSRDYLGYYKISFDFNTKLYSIELIDKVDE